MKIRSRAWIACLTLTTVMIWARESAGAIVVQGGLAASADSISASLGGARSDPEGVAPSAANVTMLTWKDARHVNRTMVLNAYLYQYAFTFDDNNQVVSRTANDDAYGHEGFGYVVSHNTQTGNSPLGKANAATQVETTVFAGGHHAIHRVEFLYDRDKEGGGNGIKIPVVIEWLTATGRDHPVWAVTWKMGSVTNPGNVDFNNYRMDTRGPYGSLNFDGAANRGAGDAIGGVAWGDFGLKFVTTDAQLTLNSPWTYNTANTVCFTQAWTETSNAEMGIVETRTLDKQMGYQDRVVGRERGSTSASAYLNKGDCNGFGDNRNYVMPCVSGWPYQLMNYDWDASAGKPVNEATGTKLIAWGTPYGFLGSSSFDLFDYSATADGRGDRSYATFIVLGPKCRYNAQSGQCEEDGDVAIAIHAVEALAAAAISNVNPGSLVTQVSKGPGASETKSIAQGYNDTYAAYYLSASGNQVSFTFTPAGGKPVKNPIFVIQNYTAGQLPGVTLGGNGVALNTGLANSGAFASINTTTHELWITLNTTLTAATNIQISNCPTWYRDADADGYGDLNQTLVQCPQPNGYVADATDCDDTKASVHPGAAEVCGNGVDDDCNGQDAACATTWYRDADGDGYGNLNATTQSVTQPAGYVSDHTDCDDANADIHPNAAEVCGNSIDEDCDGQNTACSGTWYRDADGDGYGDPDDTQQSVTQPSGYVPDQQDCDDANASAHPGSAEVCGNSFDEDCDGQDAACPTTWHRDQDGDSYGDADETTQSVAQPAGYVTDATDCNDGDAAIHPGATDSPGDGIDQDCSGGDAAVEHPPVFHFCATGMVEALIGIVAGLTLMQGRRRMARGPYRA